MIGAGGVATVCAFKIAQNTDVFGELMIASHHKEKCDRLVDAIHASADKLMAERTVASIPGRSPAPYTAPETK